MRLQALHKVILFSIVTETLIQGAHNILTPLKLLCCLKSSHGFPYCVFLGVKLAVDSDECAEGSKEGHCQQP
jgi:hypothetical protein